MERGHGGGGGAGGGGTALGRSENEGRIPALDRYLSIFQPASFSASAGQNFELSEDDIFSVSSDDFPPSAVEQSQDREQGAPSTSAERRANFGILAVLSDGMDSGSGETVPAVVNRRISVSAAASASSSVSPTSRIKIPRPPSSRMGNRRLVQQSAPVNVPMMPTELQRRSREMDDAASDGEDEEDIGVTLPPHEVVAARNTPILSSSVMEGAGRTLKGRDLRQVRNAVWRKTGFLD